MRLAAASVLAMIGLVAADANANGAFPASGQILVDPSNPSTLWIRTTYGYAKTTDAGDTFHLICEEGVGYSNGFHPHAAITQTGALFMGLADGLVVGRGDTCSFERAPELEDSFVTDVSMGPDGRAIALVLPPNGDRARVYASDDDVQTWAQLGSLLPEKLTPLTLDAAPSDPDVIYVSALTQGNMIRGTVLSSLDGGATWDGILIPGSDAVEVAPFIAGIDPNDPGRIFVRLNGAPGRLLVSDNYGASFDEVLTTTGFLYAFKLTPDGSEAYFGGNMDGLHHLDTSSFEDTPLASLATRCVTLDDGNILSCGEESADGFSAGISRDGGETFSPLLQNRCFEGILPCDATSPVAEVCEPQWPMIKSQIGATGDCDEVGGAPPGTGGASSQGGGGQAPSTTTVSGQGGEGGTTYYDGDGYGDEPGCSCATTSASNHSWSWLAVLGGAFLIRRRRDAMFIQRCTAHASRRQCAACSPNNREP